MLNRRIAAGAMLAAALLAGREARAQWNVPSPPVYVEPDHESHIYKVGETMKWTVRWEKDGEIPADVKYRVQSGGLTDIGGGPLKFDGKVAHFESKLDAPNSVLATVSWDGGGPGKQAFGGALADPFEIQPAAKEPEDFGAFWQAKLAELRATPANPKLTDVDVGVEGIKYAKIDFDMPGGQHAHGQIARPDKPGKFPALFQPQYAGVYPLQKQWVTDRAKQGWLAINLIAHDLPIDAPEDFYKRIDAVGGPTHDYFKIGNDDRDKSYYLRMYLSLARAIDYLKTRDDWDGKVLIVEGQSQGGQQSVVAAGLCPDDVTACLPFVPAASDMWAESAGRLSGYPFWYTLTAGKDADAVRRTSLYFDPGFFARRIKCPVYAGVALRDDLAPPSSVFAMYNQIRSPKEIMILARAKHVDENDLQQPYWRRFENELLPTLAKGQTPERIEYAK